jgi:hypothetical protein
MKYIPYICGYVFRRDPEARWCSLSRNAVEKFKEGVHVVEDIEIHLEAAMMEMDERAQARAKAAELRAARRRAKEGQRQPPPEVQAAAPESPPEHHPEDVAQVHPPEGELIPPPAGERVDVAEVIDAAVNAAAEQEQRRLNAVAEDGTFEEDVAESGRDDDDAHNAGREDLAGGILLDDTEIAPETQAEMQRELLEPPVVQGSIKEIRKSSNQLKIAKRELTMLADDYITRFGDEESAHSV